MRLEARNPARLQTVPGPRDRGRTYGDVIFRATYDAMAMYVLVRSNPRGVHILSSMERIEGGDEWQVSLRLPRGGYRYRYFADLGGMPIQLSPADVEHRPVPMHRYDAALYVRDQVQVAWSKRTECRPRNDRRRFDDSHHGDWKQSFWA